MFYRETNFKESPIGRIPKEWELTKLRDIGNLTDGDWILKDDYQDTGVRLLQIGDIGIGTFLDKSRRFISHKRAKELNCTFVDVREDILISRMPDPIGRACLAPTLPYPYIVAVDISILKVDSKKADRKFIVYVLNHEKTLKKVKMLSSGATRERISRNNLETITIPLPPLEEQQKIAEILSTIDAAIEQTDAVIAKIERLKKGLMQELLTKGIGHKEFKDTEIGRIPKDWEVVRLKELVDKENDIVAGPFGSNLKVCDYREEGVPIIRLQNIERNRFINKDLKFISPKKAEQLKYHSFKAGDIILAKLGDPIGKTCIVPDYLEYGIVVADVVRIRLSPKKANKYFFTYILNSSICLNQLRKETIGSTRPRVNISQVRNLKVPLPPLPEQQKIAEILSAIDERLEIERTEKATLERIKREMMNLLLTGKVRVKCNKNR